MHSNQERIPKKEEAEATFSKKVRNALSILFCSKMATVSLLIVFFWVFVSIFAPLLTSYSPTEQDWKHINEGPSRRHPLGTDELGRDLWSRILHGSRFIFAILPVSENLWIPGGIVLWGVFLALSLGATLGLISGFRGGIIDEILMRLVDAWLSIPYILFYLIIIVTLGASAINVAIAIAVHGTPGVARLVRSLTLDIRTRDYVRAAETGGENSWYIMFVIILPNARGPVLVDAMFRVGYAIFAMGTLGFLGLGLPPPSPDWGSMVAKGREFIMIGSPWAAIWPSLAIASIVVSLNLYADELRSESLRYQ
ncbi:MAG: ABC transporter permease [Thermodesulfobacteriota bacterium]